MPTTRSNLVASYDLVIDCSDNFRTKFLVNDAAVLTRKPAVFASVYQYEGQLQVYKPDANHACLRCLWPDVTTDGIVGNCAEAGVLGPVPGAFGAMQALLALKILLGLPGQLDGELLLLNFMNFTQLILKAPRRAACAAPSCSLVRSPEREIAQPRDRTEFLGQRRRSRVGGHRYSQRRGSGGPPGARKAYRNAGPARRLDRAVDGQGLFIGLRLGQAQRRNRA